MYFAANILFSDDDMYIVLSAAVIASAFSFSILYAILNPIFGFSYFNGGRGNAFAAEARFPNLLRLAILSLALILVLIIYYSILM